MMAEREFRGIVRVAGKDVNGNFTIQKALSKVKGVGVSLADLFSDFISKELNVKKKEKIGNLTEDELEKIEEIIKNPANHGVPEWYLNRPTERQSGKTSHLIGSDLDFQKRQDIESKKTLRTYHGVRHMYGLPVWGGRCKTRARTGTTMGVIKKKEKPGQAPASKEDKKERKK